MSFQKCPNCNGSGNYYSINYGVGGTQFNSICHSCSGYGIINEQTGHPPCKMCVEAQPEKIIERSVIARPKSIVNFNQLIEENQDF